MNEPERSSSDLGMGRGSLLDLGWESRGMRADCLWAGESARGEAGEHGAQRFGFGEFEGVSGA
jgi:hypothetical protein